MSARRSRLLPALLVTCFASLAPLGCESLIGLGGFSEGPGAEDATTADGPGVDATGDTPTVDAPSDVGPVDAGSDARDSAPFDAPTMDVATTDAADSGAGDGAADSSDSAPPSDGGGDSGDSAPPVDAGPFCANLTPPPFFCADFDEGEDAGTSWQDIITLGGTLQTSSAFFVSPPSSMVVDTEAGSTGLEVLGGDNFNALGATGTYTYAFDVFISRGDSTASADVQFAVIDFEDQTSSWWNVELELTYSTPSSYLTYLTEETYTPEAGVNVTHHPQASVRFMVGQWTHVVIELDLTNNDGGPSGNTAKLSLDGTNVITESVDVIAVQGYPSISLGLPSDNDPANEWTVAFDNVTFDYEP